MSDSPEQTQANRKRIAKALASCCGDGDAFDAAARKRVVDLIVYERIALRETIVNDILSPLIDRYPAGLNNDQLETLGWVIEYFVRDPDGSIQLMREPPSEKRGGLRSL